MSERIDNIRIKPEPDGDASQQAGLGHDARTTGVEMSSPVSAAQLDDLPGDIFPSRRNGRSGKKSRKGFKHGKFLLWGLVPVFFALLYIVGSYLLVPAILKGPVAGKLSATLNRPVTVSRVIFSPFSLQLFLSGIYIGGMYGDKSERNLLECKNLQARLGLQRIFGRQLIVRQVVIDGLSLNMERTEQGAFSVEQVVQFLSFYRDSNRQDLWPDWLVLDGINVNDGQILLDDRRTKKHHRIEQIRFYLPSVDNGLDSQSVLPRLNAVFNSSPVQIDGHRSRNNKGIMETRFHFTLSQVVLGSYLEYIPFISESGMKLTDGQADIHLNLIIPEISGFSQNILLGGTADVEAVRFQDNQNHTVFKVPKAYVDFSISPVARQFHFNTIVLESPELNISVTGGTKGEKEQNFSFNDLGRLLTVVGESPNTFSCDRLLWKNGTVLLLQEKSASSGFVWKNVEFSLEGFSSKISGSADGRGKQTASFIMSGQGNPEETPMKFSTNGNLFSDYSVQGKVSVSNLDLKKYSALLPPSIRFKSGRAHFDGLYEYGSLEKKEKFFKLYDGHFRANGFSILGPKKKNILAGQQLSCRKLEADFNEKVLSCERLEADKTEIYADRVKLGNRKQEPDTSTWKVLVDGMHIQGSTLHKSVANPFDRQKDIRLKLENFSLEASELGRTSHARDNISASGTFSNGGTLTVAGVYSLPENTGRLQAVLKDVGPGLLKPFLSPWFSPVIRDGLVHAQGIYLVEKKQFDGSIVLDRFVAGHRKESYVSLKKVSSESVHIGFKPFVMEIDKILVDGPVVVPGVSNAGKTAEIFLRPSKKSSGKSKRTIKINTVRLINGRYRLSEPVLFPGYQPEISSIRGTISSIGGQSEPVSYSFEGLLEDQALFKMNGITEIGELSNYSLNVTDFPLEKFGTVFQVDAGLNTSHGRGNWHQIMLREDEVYKVSSRVILKDIRPEMNSRYARIASLYTDDEHSIRIDTKEIVAEGEDLPFLLQSIIRYLQRDSVKAEIAQKLVLERLLPDLKLEERVLFAPGTTILVDPSKLGAYGELLKKRPYLLLELQGGIDPELDGTSLQNILQQEENMKREAENKRRALKRVKILEQEKAKLAEMNVKQGQVVEETIQSRELVDLQPLPPALVRVSDEMLAALARNRADALRKYCINQLSLTPERVVSSEETGNSGAFVQVMLQPYLNQQLTLDDVKQNDTKGDREYENSPAF